MKKVLRKIIKNWVTYYLPEWWWGWGDIDTNWVNALIDLKLWNYDSLFQMNSWLYKILNSIDEDDELGLESWETRNDIIANASSMSKISHCYAVMCCIVNSEYSMSKILENANATKEVSECWNSISIIGENEEAKNLYLNSENWIINLLTYETAQDVMWNTLTTEQQTSMINNNILIIVNNNSLLENWYKNSLVENAIKNNSNCLGIISWDITKLWIVLDDNVITTALWNNWNSLVNIAWDTDKLELVKSNTNIMNKLAVNSWALNEISDSDFFKYILEKSSYLWLCSNSTAWKNKINSYQADDLLEPIYFYTWDLWYSSWTELAEDSEAINKILKNSNASKIALNNNACKQYIPYTWGTFNYTWSDQLIPLLLKWVYKIECWWAWSRSAKWWYASWTFTFTQWINAIVMVGANWNNWNWQKYWFSWSANGWSNASWWWLSWVFTWTATIWVDDSARALIIAWWAGWSSAWTGWAWWGETWWTWTWSYWTAWGWWTQTWRWSWWNAWSWQFRWWNGSWTYWYWWWWGWWWWNGSQWDWSWDDDKWGGWGSWYVSTNYSMTWKVLTQWWWLWNWQNWKVVITRL